MKRVIILFLVKQLVLIGILYLALDLYPDFSIDGQRTEDVKITIGKGDTQTGVIEINSCWQSTCIWREKCYLVC